MKKEQIHIRDPFVLFENGIYYLYGTRGEGYGLCTKGFDVYTSDDLENWSDPIECFDSERYGLNASANWAPEVHTYRGKYYMFATFTQENGKHGTYSLRADNPLGPFVPISNGALTPKEWESLDGTLYVDEGGTPYLVFCHEHIQILDGTICYAKLNETLDAFDGEIVTMFAASESGWADAIGSHNDRYVTDGPFLYRSKTGELFMIWSSFVKGKYAEMLVRFKNGKFGLDFEHITPLMDDDGGHGMIFADGKHTYFIYHTPNKKGLERPGICLVEDKGDTIRFLK